MKDFVLLDGVGLCSNLKYEKEMRYPKLKMDSQLVMTIVRLVLSSVRGQGGIGQQEMDHAFASRLSAA